MVALMSPDFLKLLRSKGPGLTSDFIDEMVKDGASPATARKRIQRAEGSYQRLAGLRFEKNARFIYLDEQYGTRTFWERFEQACKRSGKSYWATITMLRAKGGSVPETLFPRITGAPLARTGQLSPQRILERLEAVNLLKRVSEGERDYVQFNPAHFGQDDLNAVLANEIAEAVALQGIMDWARRIGFGSYSKFQLRGGETYPAVSGVVWDLTAPSYMRPLVSVSAGSARPGFVVCDINLRGEIEENEALAFVRKCDMAAAPQKVPPIMPMLVGHVFTAEALQTLKGKGILAITLRNLFGEELAETLKELVVMLTDLGAKISGNPDLILKVMKTLSKIGGESDNLRGALFELVVGALVKDVEGGYLTTGQRRTDLASGRKVEIDVQLNRGEEKGVLVVECKAKNPNARVSEAELQKWYDDRVPLIHSILSNDTREPRKFEFELWTNGEFTKSGLTWFDAQQKQFEGYTVAIKAGSDLKAYARRAANPSLRDTLNEYYFRSALSKVIPADQSQEQ